MSYKKNSWKDTKDERLTETERRRKDSKDEVVRQEQKQADETTRTKSNEKKERDR